MGCGPVSDVFISYKHEDGPRIALLQSALERVGLDVWWDKKIPAAERWRSRILAELESAKCVLVAWSEASTGSAADFVMDEANRAKKRGTLLQVRIDDVELPLGFGELQALDLIRWEGDDSNPGFQEVVAAARARVEGRPIRPPLDRRVRRRAVWAGGSSIFLATAILIASQSGVQRIACKVPGLREVCGEMGLGGVPSRTEEALWLGRRSGDCDALRSFLRTSPRGVYAKEAQARLAGAKIEAKETWTEEERRLPLVVPSGLRAFPTRQAAQDDAIARAPKEAQEPCLGFNQGEFRLRSVRGVPTTWECSERLGGHFCGFNGEAVCEVQVRHLAQVETCP